MRRGDRFDGIASPWPTGRVRILPALLFCAAVGAFLSPAAAAQRSAQFDVNITLTSQGQSPHSAFCRTSNAPGAFGATVTVVCSTGAVVDVTSGESGMPWIPMHGGAYRYAIQVRRLDELMATVESETGPGTVTSWRVVHFSGRDYVELTVLW